MLEPVGVELLTQLLGDVPHAAPDPIWFSHSESYRLSKRRSRVERDDPLEIVVALWRVNVKSVPSSLRAWVRGGVLSHGLPRVRGWLRQSFPSTELDSDPACKVLLREGHRVLLFEFSRSRFENPVLEELPVPDGQRPS